MNLKQGTYRGSRSIRRGKSFSRLAVLCFLVLGIQINLFSQAVSEKGWVRSSTYIGCADLSITLVHQRSGGGELFYSFEGNPDDPIASNIDGSFNEGESSISHTYDTPGTFVIIIIDQTDGLSDEERIDRLEITVLPNDPPKTSVTSCQGRSILINFDKANDPFDAYRILFGDGIQQTFSGDQSVAYTYAVSGTYEILIAGLINDGESSSCKLALHNVSAFDELPIPVLKQLTVEDSETITLSYETLTPGLLYQLEIDRGNGFESLNSLDPETHAESFQYNSGDIDFNEEHYRFRLRAEDVCGFFQEFSAVGNSIAFDILFSEVTNSVDLLMHWATASEGFTELNLYSENTLLNSFDQPNSTDDVLFSTSECNELGVFRMQGTFNNILSRSVLVDPFVTQSLELPPPAPPEAELLGANVTLKLPETDFKNSGYLIFRKDITEQFTLLSQATGPTFIDVSIPPGTGEVCYRITYEDQCGNTSEQSQEVCLALGSSLGIPNAFSPNNDGINDVFKVKDGIYLDFTLEIFNRWGNLVFRSKDPAKGWDGAFEGKTSPSGTYTYRVSFQGIDKVPFTRAGTFLLIR